MRTLAVDFGARRIGIAVSDALGISARGVETLSDASDKQAVERIACLVTELEAEAVVVGMPVRADGSVGDAASRVERFVERLRAGVGVPVHTIAEFLTTREADERLRTLGVSQKERSRRIDEMAAIVILEEFLGAQDQARGGARSDG